MSLPEMRGQGRLLTDPRQGVGKTDTPWCSALIKFSSWRKVDGTWEEGDPCIASVIAFGDTAPLLAGYAKGDEIGVHGTGLRATIYKDQPQISCTATQIWTPEKKARTAVTAGRPSRGDNASLSSGTAGLAEARAAASAHLRKFDAERVA